MSKKTPDQVSQWVQRVHSVQTSRMTPELQADMLRRVEQSRTREAQCRKVQSVKAHCKRGRALVGEGMRQMASASSGAEYQAVQERWSSAVSASESRQKSSLAALSSPAVCSPALSGGGAASSPGLPPPAAQQVVALQDIDEEEDEAMAEIAQLVGAADAGALAEDARATTVVGVPPAPGAPPARGKGKGGGGGGGGGGDDGVTALLGQLRQEPSDDAEMAAKFGIYEEYARQVENMRSTIFGLHEESAPTLPQSVAADMSRQLQSIDRPETMGIPDDAREWFVYHMMRAAEKNNRSMGAMLEDFERKLRFLSEDAVTDCPVCFEPFAADTEHAKETLSCCHTICKDCWENWKAAMNASVFCPLCRHEEFLGEMMGRASP